MKKIYTTRNISAITQVVVSKPRKPLHKLIKTKFVRYTKKVTETGLGWQNENIRFKKVVEFSPLPILVTKGISPVIDYVNPAWEKTTGFTLKEVKGKNPNIVKSSKTPANVYNKIWKELKKGNTFKTELLFDKHKNGQEFQISSTFFPIKRIDKPIFYAQIGHDITQRKIKEKYMNLHINIALLLARSKTIGEAVPKTLKYLCEGIGWELGELWLVDKEKKLLHHQGAWHSPFLNAKKFIALSEKTTFALGKGLPGRVWATGKPAWIINSTKNSYFPNILIATKSGLTTALAFPILIDFKTIGVLTFFTLGAREPDDDLLKTMRSLGNHLGQFIEHKHAEEMLKQLTTQQQLILNAVGQGIYGVDNNGYVTFINPAAEKMLGWKYKELIGKRLHDIIHYTKNDQKTPLTYTQCPNYNKIQQNETKPQLLDNEIFWRKDGTNFPVEYMITPIMNGAKVIGAVGTFIDITKRYQLENLKKEFLATAAHELKTPITTLKLLSQHQLMKLGKNQQIAPGDLELMSHELDRLTRIINDILDDQRVETGKLSLKIEIIELTSLIDRITKQMRSLPSKHQIIYKKGEKIDVAADADRISQVLTNLISNAIKYSPEGTPITITTKKLKQSMIVSVEDHGIGIPTEGQLRIFDRFYQIQEGKSAGFGLGLYIAKQIIERHLGRIWVKSKEGKGSTFYFSLSLIK
jgi:PAS domain S-box-containing protein